MRLFDRINTRALRMFFISYAAVFFIPIVVITGLINFYVIPSIKYDILQANAEKMESTATRFTEILTDLEQITYSIGANPYLTPFNMKSSSSYEGQRQLRLYRQSSFILADIVYCIHGEEKLITSETSSLISNFTAKTYPFREITSGFYTETIPSLSKPMAFSLSLPSGKEYLAFIYPVYLPYGDVSIIYLVEADTLSNIFNTVNSRYGENVLLFNTDMSICLETKKNKAVEYDWLDKLELSPDYGIISQQFIDGQYFVSSMRLGKMGLTLMSVTDNDTYMSLIYQIQWLFTVVMLIVIIIGLVFIFAISGRKYRPINTILQQIPLEGDDENINEFLLIHRAMDTLSSQNKNFKDKLNNYQNVLRRHIIKEAPKGGLLNDIDYDELIVSDHSKQYTCLVAFSPSGVEMRLYSIAEANDLLCTDPNAPILLSAEDTGDGQAIFVIAVPRVTGIAEGYAERLTDLFYPDVECVIGYGKLYDDILSVSKSYNDAVLQLSKQNSFVSDGYSHNNLEQLKSAILNDNADKIQSILMELFSSLARKKLSKFMLHSFILDILSMLMELTIEHKLIREDIQIKLIEILDISSYRSETMQIDNNYLINACIDVCNFICEHINWKTRLIENVKQYISEHHSDKNFSVESLAEHYKVQMPYLSMYFKSQTGSTIISYLWTLRKESAERYLLTTELPVKDIVEMVGYYDVSSFTRKFKAANGLSPGEYRRSFREIEK